MFEIDENIKGKVLVVDDDPLNILIVKDALDNMYELEIAMSGEEALEKLKLNLPDIVLLDIMMPTMDGYDVTREIRKIFPDEFIKVILLSAKMNLKDRLIGYEAGADDYITKPYDEGELIAKIRVFLNLKSVQDKLQESKKNLEDLNNTLEHQVKIRTNQLLEAERHSSIGKHAAGIVHNLNNPLAAVIGYSQLVMNHPEVAKAENLKTWVQKVLSSADLMKEIIASILVKSKDESNLAEKEIDLNEVLQVIIDILNASSFFKNEVNLSTSFGNIPKMKGIYSHFSQSLGNIINNAVDAMIDSEEKSLKITTNSNIKEIIITIEDTGCGIPEQNLNKIFDPFFTTKPLNTTGERPSGTGLGMASSKQMLEAYGGVMHIESELNKGTIFTITLPLYR